MFMDIREIAKNEQLEGTILYTQIIIRISHQAQHEDIREILTAWSRGKFPFLFSRKMVKNITILETAKTEYSGSRLLQHLIREATSLLIIKDILL